MMPPFLLIDPIISRALAEDMPAGDITTQSVVPVHTMVSGRFIAKVSGVICGLEVMQRVFSLLDPTVTVVLKVGDGQEVIAGTVIAEIDGPAAAVLSGERVALNFLQHLSGISTFTSNLVKEVRGTRAKIVDTRKTTPGLRVLEKYAVRMGGGGNHRMNLSDGVLIKDNHIQAAGGINNAVQAAIKNAPATLKIEVEVESLDQVQEALSAGADIIMLDNMDLQTMVAAVTLIGNRAITEASGNMDRRNIREVAQTGVHIISVGALTHSVQAMDISLRLF